MKNFIDKGIFGFDLCKDFSNRQKIPEAMGLTSGTVFLVFSTLLLPFLKKFEAKILLNFISLLLTITSTAFLGFVDNVLDLKWRYKLILPVISSLPLVLVYFLNINVTTILMPKIIARICQINQAVDIGPLYYLYLVLHGIFCTNSINILAGINGLEAGQALVISLGLILNNFYQMAFNPHVVFVNYFLSNFVLLNFFFSSFALFFFNYFPAEVFVGDVFCYLAGMTLASCSILTGNSKTLILFMFPQIVNFLISVPQLFGFVNCPRHRLPWRSLKGGGGLLTKSQTEKIEKKKLSATGKKMVEIFSKLKIVECEESETQLRISNFTLLNFFLIRFGDMKEEILCNLTIFCQILWLGVAFFIRYRIAPLIF